MATLSVTYTGQKLSLPPAEYLRECFSYDAGSGILTWQHRSRARFVDDRAWRIWNTRYADKQAGGIRNHGYFVVCLDYRLYLHHRIIWKMMTGEDPSEEIDHKDQNRTNNRWENLRAATHRQNTMNRVWGKNSELPKGVSRNGKGYMARATVGRVINHLGTHATPEEAHAAYVAFIRDDHGEFFYSQAKL
jgi:hypothetical protein